VPISVKGSPTKGSGNVRVYGDQHVHKARLLNHLINSETAARVVADLIDNKTASVPGFTLALTWSAP
jgi:hypothetical protein